MDEVGYRHNKVMVIDDTKLDRFIVAKICEGALFSRELIQMASGVEALKYLGRFIEEPGQLPEVIFLDINMPVMDGFEFLQQFSLMPGTIHQAIKVYLLTSSINPQDKERASINPHVVGMLNKPLTREKLAGII